MKLRKAIQHLSVLTMSTLFALPAIAHTPKDQEQRFVQIQADTRDQRTALIEMGVSIESVMSDSVWGFATSDMIRSAKEEGFKVLGEFDLSTARGGHEESFGFPSNDARFHDYSEMTTALTELNQRNSDISKIQSIGKTVEGRDILAIHINTSPEALETGHSNKPGVIFMGNHHAREHLSAEIPLMLAQHLLGNRNEARVAGLIDSRDIWIIPMVNPDGVEWDISTGRYKTWRKNRKNNGDGTYGVDLNRNYGFQWGTGGSSTDTTSEVYMGKAPFSEPETQAIRDFVRSQNNTKVLLSFHTYSELILYPWGHTYNDISNGRDQAVYTKMARTMAQWNRYTPQQSSELYIASGDTTDWAYGELGIFAFTFELSPKSPWDGGFYPGAGVIDRVFQANLQPTLYMIETAGDPYGVLNEPSLSPGSRWEQNPMESLFPASHYVQ